MGCALQGVSLAARSPEHNCRSGKGKNIAENEEKNVIKRFKNINNGV